MKIRKHRDFEDNEQVLGKTNVIRTEKHARMELYADALKNLYYEYDVISRDEVFYMMKKAIRSYEVGYNFTYGTRGRFIYDKVGDYLGDVPDCPKNWTVGGYRTVQLMKSSYMQRNFGQFAWGATASTYGYISALSKAPNELPEPVNNTYDSGSTIL